VHSGGSNLQTIEKRFTLENPALNEVLLSVQPVVHGCYGVFADAVLIAIYFDQASADAHCQRLLNQQAQG
jgi:hypothetical protein